mgnify:CR=1 FL=1
MIQQGGLVHRAGVVVQPTGDGQVHGEVLLRYAEGRQILHHRLQLRKAGVEHLIAAPIALQRRQHLLIGAGDGDEAQDIPGGLLGETQLPGEKPVPQNASPVLTFS